ncbi:WYL domain-containing protein [Vagococcus carniphilus]|uniref:helix-turn-helix transcriptional regulator n=1 Tax=Vagococcus carniphilus TaxID=218144 RepID=UPI00288CDF39|nr:WYL domain-containing protein [Vagococcus carniphilus]MDT2849138.1 WYL domain-containing protein [Vagococcus carniphilus]
MMNSQQRMLIIFLRLLSGKKITKRELMEEFDKQSSTIQRDIGYIEEVLLSEENGGVLSDNVNIERDGRGNYQLKNIGDISNLERLTDTDILILLKILHSTRLFNQEEFFSLSNKLIATADNQEVLKQFIANEQLYYEGISSNGVIEKLEMVIKAIVNHNMLEFSYAKNGVTAVFQRVPNAIYFSDLYFYMMSSSHTAQDDFDLLAMNKFKVHSMIDIKVISSHNRVDYKDKFEGGVLRNQGVLPFFGNPITIVLDFYYDPIYVLDRFPNSIIIQENDDGSIRISIQGNDGYGVKMWLLGQGHHVKVISPKHIKDYLIQNMKDTLTYYDIETNKK